VSSEGYHILDELFSTGSLTDYYGSAFKQGEVLRFKEQHFLPYHGGHTIVFDERSLYLQEEENADILAHFSSYVMKVT
jgi:hypothetical protein